MTKTSTKTSRTSKAVTGTKQDRVLAMLRSKRGATIAAIVDATGWQPHTARAFISAVVGKRLGLQIESEKAPGKERIYRIVAGKPARRGVRAAKGKK